MFYLIIRGAGGRCQHLYFTQCCLQIIDDKRSAKTETKRYPLNLFCWQMISMNTSKGRATSSPSNALNNGRNVAVDAILDWPPQQTERIDQRSHQDLAASDHAVVCSTLTSLPLRPSSTNPKPTDAAEAFIRRRPSCHCPVLLISYPWSYFQVFRVMNQTGRHQEPLTLHSDCKRLQRFNYRMIGVADEEIGAILFLVGSVYQAEKLSLERIAPELSEFVYGALALVGDFVTTILFIRTLSSYQ